VFLFLRERWFLNNKQPVKATLGHCSFSLRHFGHLSHSCIETRHCSISNLYFQTFWPKWLNFFRSIQKTFRSMTEKQQLWRKARTNVRHLQIGLLYWSFWSCWIVKRKHSKEKWGRRLHKNNKTI